MDLRKVLFIGGDVRKLASVQIRCVDIAYRLGCDCILKIKSINDVPNYYSWFVCVKSGISKRDINKLAKKGKIIWDIIDVLPPTEDIAFYLSSTRRVQEDFSSYGRVELIPHHHCNFSSRPNSFENRRPGWIGNNEWCPQLEGLDYEKFSIRSMTQSNVVDALRKIGIGLNYRGGGPWTNPQHPAKLQYDFHVALNSGIKLINCLGFGTPSVSADESAYREVGEDCTIFSDPSQCAHWVKELQINHALYGRLRKNCLQRSKRFHLDNIATEYKNLLQSL